MKKIISVIAALALGSICLLNAQNQGYFKHIVKWYEDLNVISVHYGVPVEVLMKINALEGTKLKARQVLEIPVSPEYWNVQDGDTAAQAAADSTAASEIVTDPNSIQLNSRVDMAVILPFSRANGGRSNSNVEFYSGMLLALRDAGNEGIDIVVDALDLDNDAHRFATLRKDVIVGPIQAADLENVLGRCDSTTIVVSPLDRKADQLLCTHTNLVQAAPAPRSTYSAAIKWAREENEHIGLTPNYILLGSAADTTAMAEAVACLEAEGISGYSRCSCTTSGDLQGWDEAYRPNHQNVVIAAIVNEAILNNAIRNMRIIMRTQENITLMCNNKVMSYDSIPLEDIHKSNTHSLCPYHIDYSDPKTLDFIHQYRALYNCEPTRFSFQGYDIAMFIARTYSKFGSKWMDYITYYPETGLLQTSFKFERAEEGGLINCGERKVILAPNYKVLLAK